MWGFKAAERVIEPSISFEDAKRLLREQGFHLHASHPAHAVLKHAGKKNWWMIPVTSGRNVPLELAIASSYSGLYFHLRYDTLVLFDTGDLDNLANEFAALLRPSEDFPSSSASSPRPTAHADGSP